MLICFKWLFLPAVLTFLLFFFCKTWPILLLIKEPTFCKLQPDLATVFRRRRASLCSGDICLNFTSWTVSWFLCKAQLFKFVFQKVHLCLQLFSLKAVIQLFGWQISCSRCVLCPGKSHWISFLASQEAPEIVV